MMDDLQDEFSRNLSESLAENLSEFMDEFKQKLNLNQLIEWVDGASQFDASELKSRLKSEIKTQVSVSSRPLSSMPRRSSIPRKVGNNSGNFAGDRPTSPINVEGKSPDKSNINVEAKNETSDNEPSNHKVSETVGGLGETLKQLQNLVEIPLKHPEILQKLGIEPPKGILLIGAPGTGKTLTARSLAQNLGVNFIAIVATEIMSKYYGEAEAKLRELFQKATTSKPCLVFIDEIDALMPNRDRVEGEVEKRVVAQMLGLMDGFKQNSGIIILAATNRPDALDPALRRPGRFDREIVFPIPNAAARAEIFTIHTRNMPLAGDVDLIAIANNAHGFVGADIKGLCQTAAYIALDRQIPSLDLIPETSSAQSVDRSQDLIAKLQVRQADFETALQKVKPSVLRSLSLESPQVRWSEIGGLESVKQNLQEAVSGCLSNPELYTHLKARSPKGILLTGAPGTGKTLLAKAIATASKANFIAITASDLISKWVGATEQAIKELFTQAKQAKPCVIFIDEIDTIVAIRGSNQGDSGIGDRLIGQLLTELDGITATEGILMVAATNRPESIDPALLRSGRLELHIAIGLPDLTARKEILKIHNCDRPCASVDLDYWSVLTEGWNGADLAFLSNRAAVSAIRRHQFELGTNPNLSINNLEITTADFERAYQELNKQLNLA